MDDTHNALLLRFWFKNALRVDAVDDSNIRAFTLGRFLQSDVQGSRGTAMDWLDRLDQVSHGEVKEDDGTGNAFTVYLDPREVRIQNAIFPEDPRYPTQHYSHDEFRTALLQVLSALESRQAERSKT